MYVVWLCVWWCRYGVGYHLTLVKGRSCDTGRLSELIKSTVPGSQLASDVSAELTFLLPFTSSQHFSTLLDTLESKYSPPLSSSLSFLSLSLVSLLDFFKSMLSVCGPLPICSLFPYVPPRNPREMSSSFSTSSFPFSPSSPPFLLLSCVCNSLPPFRSYKT